MDTWLTLAPPGCGPSRQAPHDDEETDEAEEDEAEEEEHVPCDETASMVTLSSLESLRTPVSWVGAKFCLWVVVYGGGRVLL
jgi:hypothetical protein